MECATASMNSKLKNRIFIVLIVISNTVGNLFLGIGMAHMPSFRAVTPIHYFVLLIANYWILGGVGLLIIWMVSQLSMFTWADLTYVLPVTASAYVITAILSKVFLYEQISISRWVGIALISLGVVFVSETPARTKPEPGAGAA
jgi:drug/metabolite transporter (DMT)-like permease